MEAFAFKLEAASGAHIIAAGFFIVYISHGRIKLNKVLLFFGFPSGLVRDFFGSSSGWTRTKGERESEMGMKKYYDFLFLQVPKLNHL